MSTAKTVPPEINETAFNCPHCRALAKQLWLSAAAEYLDKDSTPSRFDDDSAAEFCARVDEDVQDSEQANELKQWAANMATGAPFLHANNAYRRFDVQNISFSECFNCNKLSVWIHNRLLWPAWGEGPLASSDMPDDIRRDF